MVAENCPNFMKNSILNINSNQSRINLMRPTPRHVIDKLPKIKTENHKSNKKKMTHHVQEILSKIGSWSGIIRPESSVVSSLKHQK